MKKILFLISAVILPVVAGCEEKSGMPDYGNGFDVEIKPGYPLDEGDIEQVTPMTARNDLSAKMTVNGSQITLSSDKVTKEVKVVLSADTHLVDYDEREAPYRQYSTRMHASYSDPAHKIITADADLQQYFRNFIAMAVTENASAMFSLGDLFSYPSEYAIEWVQSAVSGTSIPFYLINGNHDWHYEMSPGTPDQIRENWTDKRLSVLYPEGVDPMCYSVEIDGIRFVLIDDSTDEVKLKQLEFIRTEIATGKPIVLLMHVPMYAKGRSYGWSLAYPSWRYNTAPSKNYFDKTYFEGEYARSNPMHTNVTKSFYNEVLSADNVIACIAGHIHASYLDMINDMPMLTIAANYKNNSYCLTIVPTEQN